MDIISHGLWGGVAFGRKSKKTFWQSFFFGIVPDLFSFGIYTFASVFKLIEPAVAQRSMQHDMANIPQFVQVLYNYTHSLVIFALVFVLVWLVRKKPWTVMLAWPLHILVDIPTHANTFFPTPFLWPLSNYNFDGINWGNPIIFFPNLALLATAYFLWWQKSRKNKKALNAG